jgi:hypothetical protein
MNRPSDDDATSGYDRSDELQPAAGIVMPGFAHPTIYDVARVAGVAPSTVSRALSKPGRVSYQTAEHVRRVAEELGYRTGRMERAVSERGTGLLAIVVADVANPVFFRMIRGAERAATGLGFTVLLLETQESESTERQALDRLIPEVDGVVLSSSRMSDAAIRSLAKRTPTVLLNRIVSEVSSVVIDNVHAIKKATEHLAALGHTSISYLGGPRASWADGARWRGLREGRFGARASRAAPRPVPADHVRRRSGGQRVDAQTDIRGHHLQRSDSYRISSCRHGHRPVSAWRCQRDRLRQHRRRGSGGAQPHHDRGASGQSGSGSNRSAGENHPLKKHRNA